MVNPTLLEHLARSTTRPAKKHVSVYICWGSTFLSWSSLVLPRLLAKLLAAPEVRHRALRPSESSADSPSPARHRTDPRPDRRMGGRCVSRKSPGVSHVPDAPERPEGLSAGASNRPLHVEPLKYGILRVQSPHPRDVPSASLQKNRSVRTLSRVSLASLSLSLSVSGMT